jgi:hypothetical protein
LRRPAQGCWCPFASEYLSATPPARLGELRDGRVGINE